MDNKIYRSRGTKMMAGVCGGIAEMYDIDPTLVRLVVVALTFLSGFALVLAYVICALIIPLEPSPGYILQRQRQSKEEKSRGYAPETPDHGQAQRETQSANANASAEESYDVADASKTVVKAYNDYNATDGNYTSSEDSIIISDSDRY